MNNWEFLNRNIGNRITPELAQGLFNAFNAILTDVYKDAFSDAMKKLNAEGSFKLNVEPKQVLEYNFRLGSYGAEKGVLKPLIQAHILEVEATGAQVSISDDHFLLGEEAGRMFMFVVSTELPVGYMMVQLHRDKGTGQIIASEMYLYIQPAHRRGWLALRFLRWIQEQLKASGVHEMRCGYRETKDIAAIYKRLGFTKFATIESKVL